MPNPAFWYQVPSKKTPGLSEPSLIFKHLRCRLLEPFVRLTSLDFAT